MSNCSYDDARYVMFGVPYDRTATFRKGTRYGPTGIRVDSIAHFEKYLVEYGLDLDDIPVYDAGNLDVEKLTTAQMVRKVNLYTRKLLKHGKFPVMMGGEHSVSPGVATAFDDIVVLGIDAHSDFRDIYEGDKNNHGCAMKRIVDKFGERRVMWVGVRAVSEEEHKSKARLITSFDIQKNGIDWTIDRINRTLPKKKMYLTLDIDGIDPAYAPGTGTPEAFGMTPFDTKSIIDAFAPRLVGFDVVEVSPPIDNGTTTVLAARLITEAIAAHYLASKKSQR